MSAAVLTPPPQLVATPAGVATPPPHGPTSTPAAPPASAISSDELWRFSVDDYHRMLEHDVLIEGDPVELLDGLLVRKMPMSFDHATVTDLADAALRTVVPDGWFVREAKPLTIRPRSEPEPDVAVYRGRIRDYTSRHPTPADTALVVEVAYSSYARDRGEKWAIYARDGIPTYWIVNLEATPARLEVYSTPVAGEYTQSAALTATDRADVVLDGVVVGSVAVAELLP